jgi:hypothetical protein
MGARSLATHDIKALITETPRRIVDGARHAHHRGRDDAIRVDLLVFMGAKKGAPAWARRPISLEPWKRLPRQNRPRRKRASSLPRRSEVFAGSTEPYPTDAIRPPG